MVLVVIWCKFFPPPELLVISWKKAKGKKSKGPHERSCVREVGWGGEGGGERTVPGTEKGSVGALSLGDCCSLLLWTWRFFWWVVACQQWGRV